MPRPLDLHEIHHRLWASACAITAELEGRGLTAVQPTVELETRFNGGVAPQVADHYAGVLTSGDLPDDAKILDLGCGFGRIAIALARRLGPDVQYVGLDPNADGIEWAQRNITPRHPNFQFRRIDVKSQPYNPEGTEDSRAFCFPFEDASLDLVFMISVLTHVDLAAVEAYAYEAARVLKASGRLVTTIFLLDDEVDRLLAAGKGHFAMKFRYGESRVEDPANPELVIAHPRQRVLNILEKAGFAKTVAIHGHWSGRPSKRPPEFQDLLIAGHDPTKVFGPAAGPAMSADDLTPARRATYERIRALTNGDETQLARFLTWSNALTLNAFWWQCDGYALCLTESAQLEGDLDSLQFGSLRKLGLDQIRPRERPSLTAFYGLDDASMIEILVRSGRVFNRSTLLDALVEASENGLRVLDAIRAGRAPVLKHHHESLPLTALPPWT